MLTSLNMLANSYNKDQKDTFEIPEKQKEESILQLHEPTSTHGNRISKIAHYNYYVSMDENIEHLATELAQYEHIQALGVVDHDGQAIGVIIRSHFLNLLAKPYGRDVLKKRPVSEVMQQAFADFYHDRNILSVAEDIDVQLQSAEPIFFLLKTHEGKFAGIFSTINMLYYLSEITKKDITLARKLQMNIVEEENFISRTQFDFLSFSSMAKGIGGDFYLMKEIKAGHWLMVICDVSGKGISSSLLTCSLGGMLSFFDGETDLPNFIFKLNRYFYDTFGPEKFVTATFVKFHAPSGEVQYSDMGHSHLYLLKNEKLYKINTSNGNMPMGILPEVVPNVEKFTLKKDTSFLLLTDGILEQTNPAGDYFPLKQLVTSIRPHILGAREKICAAIKADFHKFRTTQPQDDDATFLLLHYK